ncbi:MAG: M14 family zinc carboxypeptidase [Candidatus Krumholzibacteria bacterium]|nr:M14 family zinc carboxypeptidase [Candidatus Krumholzibacteria bacterium]
MRSATSSSAVTALLALSLLLTAALAPAGEHSLVRIWFDGRDGAAFLKAYPDLDVASVKPGVGAEIVATPTDLDLLRASGLRLETVHEDLAAHYAARIQNKNGNFGGWHTYTENIAYLDSLRTEYPQLISAKWSLGLTHELRNVWCVRLSGNADIAQPDKPEILLMTMIHAREIMSGDFGLMFADHLCRNYGIDPTVTWLMDNRELYLVSIVNPDGVVYNELTDPNGGGSWRKNRRNNGGGTYGVDLNRNFPYEWYGSGSSTNPASDTYRGPSPGSEPETQAIMNLVDSRQFVTAQDLHTYSNLTLYPWGYTTTPTPDAATFSSMGQIMAQYNGYAVGTPGELLYTVNGGSFDWFYGATDSHTKIYAFSNEMGGASDGFWPPFSRRDALFQENLWPMLYLMMAAGAFAAVDQAVATDADGGLLEPGDAGRLRFQITNHGVTESLIGAQLTLTCDDPYVQFSDAARSIGTLAPRQQYLLDPPFAFTVDAACPTGHQVTVTVACATADGTIAHPLKFMVGEPNAVFFDSLSAGTGNWTLTNQWGLTTTAYSPPYALTDSPGGNYSNNWNATATLNGTYRAGKLAFWHRYALETDYDFGRVQVSADGGGWQTVASYSGQQTTWQQVTLDLDQFEGQDLSLRFLLSTDWYVTADGWYIDDVTLLGAGGPNQPPPPPALVTPADGAVVQNPVTLTVANVSDPEGDPVTYGFRVYSDPLLTHVVAAVHAVPAGGSGQTSWQAPALASGSYWWRAFAADNEEWGLLGETRSFTATTVTAADGVVIGQPRLLVIGQGSDRTELQLSLPQGGELTIKIYNARGQLVRALYQGRVDGGQQLVVWNGRDDRGRQAASGVYLVRAQTGDVQLNGRVVMVR